MLFTIDCMEVKAFLSHLRAISLKAEKQLLPLIKGNRGVFCPSFLFVSTGFFWLVCFFLSAFSSNVFLQKKQKQLETIKTRMEDHDKIQACSCGLFDCNGNRVLMLRLYGRGSSPFGRDCCMSQCSWILFLALLLICYVTLGRQLTHCALVV